MLTRYHGSLAIKNGALDIAQRSRMRKARVALACKLAHHVRHAEAWRRVRAGVSHSPQEIGDPRRAPRWSMTQGKEAEDGADSLELCRKLGDGVKKAA